MSRTTTTSLATPATEVSPLSTESTSTNGATKCNTASLPPRIMISASTNNAPAKRRSGDIRRSSQGTDATSASENTVIPISMTRTVSALESSTWRTIMRPS